jgi:hypothetical protein
LTSAGRLFTLEMGITLSCLFCSAYYEVTTMNRLLHMGLMGLLLGGAFWATSGQPALAHGPAAGRADHGHQGVSGQHNQSPFFFGNGGFGGWGFGNSGYGNGDDCCDDLYGFPGDWRRIPFFALHPPVYYSYPVARPYGYSPFAYPGWVTTPASEEEGSKEIINPFVPPKTAPSKKAQPTAAPTADDSAASGAVVADSPRDTVHLIINPYVGVSLVDQGK